MPHSQRTNLPAPFRSFPRRLAAIALLWTLAAAATAATNSQRVTLAELQHELGWTSRVVRAESIDIGDGTNRVRFFNGLRRSEINGLAVWLHFPCLPDGKAVATLDARDVGAVLRPLLQPSPRNEKKPRVMLDPGHGGEDGGAVATDRSVIEKEFTLDLARRTSMLLDEQGFTVDCTRTDDRFLSLEERAALAESWRAEVFVSLHANFARNRQASGRETYVLPAVGGPATAAGSRIAHCAARGNSCDALNTLLGFAIHRQLPGRLQAADRGLRRARYQVLRQAPCPAALIECGFLSNARDARLLASSWYRDRLARAIADGIRDYAARVPLENGDRGAGGEMDTCGETGACGGKSADAALPATATPTAAAGL